MASYTVVNKSNAAIFWHEQDKRAFLEPGADKDWYSDDLPPGQSRTVNSGAPSADRGAEPFWPLSHGTLLMDRPDRNANVTIYAKQGDRYVNWGNVWILLGKTLGNLCKSQSAMIVV